MNGVLAPPPPAHQITTCMISRYFCASDERHDRLCLYRICSLSLHRHSYTDRLVAIVNCKLVAPKELVESAYGEGLAVGVLEHVGGNGGGDPPDTTPYSLYPSHGLFGPT